MVFQPAAFGDVHLMGVRALAAAAGVPGIVIADPEHLRRLTGEQLGPLVSELFLAADALKNYVTALITRGASPASVHALVVAYLSLCLFVRTLESARRK
jgi:hypothetical protein